MPGAERYKDVPPEGRAFLENMSPVQLQRLLDAADIIAELPEDAIKFLTRSETDTLQWLMRARPAEIKELADGIELVRSFKRVGRVARWGLASLIVCFLMMLNFGEGVGKFLGWFRK